MAERMGLRGPRRPPRARCIYAAKEEKGHSRHGEPNASLAHQCKRGRRSRGDPHRHPYRFGVFAIMPFRDPIEKRSSARLFGDQDHSVRAQADAGSEPRDAFWWSAVLATRAAFAARPGAKLISVPLDGGSLSVSVGGGWRASTSLPDDVAVQLDLYLPYCPSSVLQQLETADEEYATRRESVSSLMV